MPKNKNKNLINCESAPLRIDKASPLKVAKKSKASTGAYRNSKHKNVYLKNYKDLDRYIANDFKRLQLPSKAVADYIDWLDHNITQRPLLYITHVLVNEVNRLINPYKFTLKIQSNGLKIEKLEEF